MQLIYSLIIATALCLGSCVKKEDTTAIMVETCTQVGQRCLYTPGKMGICNESRNTAACATPPCFECVSQH